ncbi:MAG: alpha/beta fold hydrolase [Methanotrichaceae archaeon]|nr:alpha/beta fold hydrolase [Methanotrichaceae archaeon]
MTMITKMKERPVFFQSDSLRLAGMLRYPDSHTGRVPAVLLLHGSLEQDKDGNLLEKRDGKPVFKKNFFLEISKRLCAAGFAAFSWDRRGFGKSERSEQWGGYLADARDAGAALETLCSQEIIDSERIAVLGQSAGVYTACLLAREDPRPKAYVLQGGLYRDYGAMMAFNYQRVVDYASRGPDNLAWVEENDLYGLMIGLNLSQIVAKARRGDVEQELSYKGLTLKLHHDPTCYLEDLAPSRQFKYIRKPVLVIHGACDLNVPVDDAFMVERELREKGNENVELIIIPNADHSFQAVPEDEELRLRERMSLKSFRRPYKEEYFQSLIDFLRRWL